MITFFDAVIYKKKSHYGIILFRHCANDILYIKSLFFPRLLYICHALKKKMEPIDQLE